MCETRHGGRQPTFLLIGAAKSGTTSLHEYLKQHPDIFMSPVKEPNYFSFAGRSPNFVGPDDEGVPCDATPDRLRVAKYAYSVCDPAAYSRLFARAGQESAVGESSVSYLYFPEAAARIQAALPDVRLVAVLRDPADRAFSKFVQFRHDGCEPLADFDEALDAEDARAARNWSPTWLYRRRGLYFVQLQRFYERFDPSRIRVYLYEDFEARPRDVLRDIFRFLEVDDRFVPDIRRRHNPSARPLRVPRYRWPEALVASSAIDGGLRRVLPSRPVDLLQRATVRANSRFTPWEPPTFAPDTRARLVEEFRADIQALAGLIGRNLSHWLQP